MTLDQFRGTALAIRDLAEISGATEATYVFPGDLTLTWNVDDGFDLLTADGRTIDVDEWFDHVDFVVVDGVESVREQPVLMAGRA
jgi:hypothetical protein